MGGRVIHLKGLLRMRRTFRGGAFLPVWRDLAAPPESRDFPPPGRLSVPMLQQAGPAARIAVRVGQRVEAGQVIGRGERPGVPDVHAPLAGTVVGLERADTAWTTDAPAVQIEPDQLQITPPRTNVNPETNRLNADDLAELADRAGLIDFRSPAASLGGQLRQAAAVGVTDIIVNALEFEAPLGRHVRLLEESAEMILAASVGLQEALKPRHLWLALDRADHEMIRRWRRLTAGHPLRIISLANKYPQAHPVLLTKVITGRDVPAGGSTLEVGVLVIELEALLALEAAVSRQEPLTSRLVLVTGPAITRALWYRVPVGTSYADLLRPAGLSGGATRVVDGGLLAGRAVTSLNAVITKQTAAVIALDHGQDWVPNPGPCVRCGWCQEDCPVGLDPQALLDVQERGRFAAAAALHPRACLECGLCSYVCPAQLPLAEAASRLKRMTSPAENGAEADHAR